MQYLLLIYGEESRWEKISDKERDTILQEYMQFSRDIATSGHLRGGNELHPTTKATSVRLRNGKRVVTDGPFAETKEALGGYYLIDARDLDHALDIAKLCPARFGGVEVRPIMVFS